MCTASELLARPTFGGQLISQRFRDLFAARFRLPPPASTPADPDNDAVKSPPPLNLPPTWTLGAPAPSEDLGTLL